MKISLFLLFVLCCLGNTKAQIGFRGGLNYANITKASSINSSSRSGFHLGIVLAPASKKIISSRTEILFSRQGYNYKTGTNNGDVNLDYIMMPQMMSINITKYVSILLGGHMAYLLNAKADSSTTTSGPGGKIMDLYNRFDYGYGGGLEVHPFKGLLLGVRANISLGNLYKQPEPGEQPSFVPSIDVKNNVFQFYLGWRLGKNQSSKKNDQ